MKKISALAFALVLACAFIGGTVSAKDSPQSVNMEAIKAIESGNRPDAFNKRSGAVGLFQITPIVLEEYNRNTSFNNPNIEQQDLYDPDVNRMVATWYVKVRIPEMLKHFGRPVTVRNVLVCYNAGIRYVVEDRELPEETYAYLQKYEAEVRDGR